ncbi:glycosyltransferase 87 family protein [Micromonospora chersina]|uniref:glycosyltransferase 87 family protein n=1 Tax=Micromonospora chersina TaxID=47854 RepID=UPI0037224BBB
MRDRRVMLLWAAFALTATVSTVLVLQRPDHLSDLHIYYGALTDLRAGRSLYGYVAENGGPFTYPPFAALVLAPVTVVPEAVVGAVWLLLTVAAVAAIAVPVGGVLAAEPTRRPLAMAAVAAVLMLSAPVQSNLRFGQVSIFIVLLALLDGMGVVPTRWRGVLVGVAAAIKLTPLLFVAYFLASGRYRDAARAVAAFLACAAVAAAVLPAESWTYWTGTVAQTSRIGDLASLGNQSLHGMLLRIGVDPASLPVVWAALAGVVCAAALLRARQLTVHGRPGHADARTLGAGALCLAGFGGVTVAATRPRRRTTAGRAWLRVGVATAATLAFFAVQPLPAGADPTFKAYTLSDVANPRYFFVCRGVAECAAYGGDEPVTFGTAVERTKVRVNGVVSAQVARLEYYSAPGGMPRVIPLLAAYPGSRTFSFRSATMTHGRLVAYAANGQPIATYDDELAAAFRGQR